MVLHIVTVMTQQSKKGSTMQAFAQLALKLTSGDKEDIRGMRIADGRHIFSVYDIMWNTGAYESRDAVTGAWTRLLQSAVGGDLEKLFTKEQFPGARQRKTPCMDLVGIQRLFAVLDGKIGEEYRKLAVASLTRILGGDLSLVREIQSNAASSAAINVLAREAVGSKRVREQQDGQALQEVQQTMEQVMEVSNAFGANLAQQKSDVADTYDLYVKMAKLQQDMASSQCSVETARQTTFAMELKTAEGKAAIAAEQKERELVHLGKLGAIEAEQKRMLSAIEAEEKRKHSAIEAEHMWKQSAVEAEHMRKQSAIEAEEKRKQSAIDAEHMRKQSAIEAEEKLKQSAIEAEHKRKQSEMDAEQKRKQNEEELRFLQRKQELLSAQHSGPKKMVQSKLDFSGKNKEDMKTYSELFVEVAKGTAPPETFGPTARHVAELYEQTFKTQPVKMGRHHMYHKDHFDIIKKWTLEFELLLQFLQQKAC